MTEYLIGFSSVIATSLISSKFTMENTNSEWYKCIKPSIAPPNWVFPVVWTTLYILLGFAFSFAINKNNKLLTILFSLNLLLNILWCYLYFYKKNIKLAFLIITMLVVNTSLLIITSKDKTIRLLLLPYLSWLIFAAVLNYKSIDKLESCKNFT